MLILADDVIKSAATLTATSTAAGHAVDALRSDSKAETWRSTAVTSQTLTATWASGRVIDAVGIAFANFLTGSTVRVRLFTNTVDSIPVVDSGVQTIGFVYAPPAGFAANNLASFAYGGGNHYFLQVAQASVRKVEVILTKPAGVDGFIEVARLVAGRVFASELSASYGAGVGAEDASQVSQTDAGGTIVDRRPVSRVASFDLSALTHNERAGLQEIIRRNGRHTPVFVSAYQPAAIASLRADMMIYGYFDNLDMMRLNLPLYSGYGLRIREI